ncbi:DUF1254 domain-containing protein [Sandarakinorhabdus oryzae]|uniref:DUF1254 domain-containing protein n=1 Tax=Sandarakinorhabdus oryzae TaxID=2675220 RepID=UPI0018CC057B|nr:DUF1254 domain-containing protein [Sandarakinorhabdus oryzae]
MRHRWGIFAVALAILAQPLAAAPARKPVPARKPAAVKPVAKPATPVNVATAPLPDTPEIQALRRAFRFGFAPYEMLRTRQLQLGRVQAAGMGSGVNTLIPRLTLADASLREVTTPNNDTLYASGWLDLSQGPVFLSIPALKRYHSATLMSITSDVVAVLGSRTAGNGTGRYAIVGPGWRGDLPAGVEMVRSSSNDAWLLVRVVVNGEEDVAAAAEGLKGFTLSAVAGDTPLDLKVPPRPDGKAFLTTVNAAIERSGDALLVNRATQFADQGVGQAWDSLNPEQQKLWNDSLPALIHELRGGLTSGDGVDGWVYPPFNMALYGDDDDLRARVALGGLAALPRIEAIYVSARSDGQGQPLTGAKSWRVKIPANVPVGAFWSLTMYQQEADGRLFFVPNELNRFAVGDRSQHLRPERDGSIELFVQAAKPSGERVVNWLPAPKGNFVLMFRAYLPGAPLLDGSFRLPPVTEGEMIP